MGLGTVGDTKGIPALSYDLDRKIRTIHLFSDCKNE